MKMVGHQQRQSRLHQCRYEEQFAESNRHTQEDRWQGETGTVADESRQPSAEHPHIEPELSAETFDETDFGVVRHGRKADGSSRVAAFIFPTTIRLTVPSPSWLRYRNAGPPLRDVYIIHTPVDDVNQIMFQAQHVKVAPAERAAYLEQYAEFRRLLEARPAREIAAQILAGERTLTEVQATGEFPFMAWIEDQCAQPGQGAIADRSVERLGRSDKGIIALRKIWSRELRALAETGRSHPWAPMTAMPS